MLIGLLHMKINDELSWSVMLADGVENALTSRVCTFLHY